MATHRGLDYSPVCRFMTKTEGGLGLTGVTLLVYARIFGFCRLEGLTFFESHQRTAEFFGVSRRQVIRAFQELEERRLVYEAGEKSIGGGRIVTVYKLNVKPALEAIVRFDDSPKDDGVT